MTTEEQIKKRNDKFDSLARWSGMPIWMHRKDYINSLPKLKNVAT